MIKFFRTIRYNLMETGKTGKYFKYAIGEIVLVVIGILIALQINNWNTNRANEKQAYNQLREVQKEILYNIEEFDRTSTFYYEKLRWLRLVFSDSLTLEDYQKNGGELREIMGTSSSIETQNEAFKKLAENADNLPDQYKPLIPELKRLYNPVRFEGSRERIREHMKKYFNLISEFSESYYREDYDPLYQFLLTSKDYKNLLVRFCWNLDDLAPELNRKKYHAITLYNQMVALGFPNDGEEILKPMFQELSPQKAEPFVGLYTNARDTISLHYNNNRFMGYNSQFDLSDQIIIKDSTTLVFYGHYLEFNDEKSEFYYLLEENKPIFKRIVEND